MNLFRSKGSCHLLRRVARRFRRGGRRSDVLVEHGAEFFERYCAIMINISHVEHLGQRFFRRGLVVARQQVGPVHDPVRESTSELSASMACRS